MRILLLLVCIGTVYTQDSGCGSNMFQFGFSGYFTSMNFDPETGTRYDANSVCQWVLETSITLGQAIQLEFPFFRVENAVNCVYDSVTAYDGQFNTDPILRVMCGHSSPNPTISSNTLMRVEFITDYSVQYLGFNATWVARDQPIECETNIAFRCGDDVNGYCIPIAQRCDGIEDCTAGEDEEGCPANSAECGRPVISPVLTPPPSTSMLGGYEALPGSWPWMANLEISFEPTCGATILNDYWVITAATCVFTYQNNPSVMDIITGEHNLDVKDPYEHKHDVSAVHIHPDYSPLKDDYNFALLKAKSKIQMNNDAVLDICRPNQDDIFPEQLEAWITGWGETAPGVFPSVMVQNNVTLHSETYCNDPSRYNGQMGNTLICAGTDTVDACQGDQGGPLVGYRGIQDPETPLIADERWYLIGVTGDRNGCSATAGLPGLYGRVSSVSNWIESTMQTN